jgi:hypothetical protein
VNKTIPLSSSNSFQSASKGGHQTIQSCRPPQHALPTHQARSSSRTSHRVSTLSSSQHNQCLDWQQPSAFEPIADLYQSYGVDASSFVAPLTNDWLYEGYGFGDGSSSSGGEGDGALDMTPFVGGEEGINGSLAELGVDWSLPELGTVQSTPIMGGEVSPASLDGESFFVIFPIHISTCLSHLVPCLSYYILMQHPPHHQCTPQSNRDNPPTQIYSLLETFLLETRRYSSTHYRAWQSHHRHRHCPQTK